MKRFRPSDKGVYVLIMSKKDNSTVRFGCKRSYDFPAGWYGYAGSAMGGLAGRLRHHCRISSRPHWHIDRLRPHVTLTGIVCAITESRIECNISRNMSEILNPVDGFGASDCGCRSHLYYHVKREIVEDAVFGAFESTRTHAFMVQCSDIVSHEE